MTLAEARETAAAIIEVASTGSPEAQEYAVEHAIALLDADARKDLLSMWPIGKEPNPDNQRLEIWILGFKIKQLLDERGRNAE